MKRTTVRLPNAVCDRLRVLAERSGRTAAFHIREAVERYLEDMEDLRAAERPKSGGRTVPLDEPDEHPGPED